MALYDAGDDGDGPTKGVSDTGGSALYDTGDDDMPTQRKQGVPRGMPEMGGSVIYDTGDDAVVPAQAETAFGFSSLEETVTAAAENPIPTQGDAPVLSGLPLSTLLIKEDHVGMRVAVQTFCEGTLRFFGPHHRDGKPRCGVELDQPLGLNNGTVGVSLREWEKRSHIYR